MWKSVFEVFRRLFTINDDLNRFQTELKRHGEQIRELAENQTRFQYELQLRLPPSKPSDEPSKD